MANRTHWRVVRVLAVLGCLMAIAGCEPATNPTLPVDWSTASTDVASFIQQFAREAFAAFLF